MSPGAPRWPETVPLFWRIVSAFLAGFLALIALVSGTLLLSYPYSARQWQRAKTAEIEAAIRTTLEQGLSEVGNDFPQDTAVFVYDPTGNFLFSNRGAGRRRPADSLVQHELAVEGRVVARYSLSAQEFHDSEPNRLFVSTMALALLQALLVAFALAALLAWRLARSISVPAKRLQEALAFMRGGSLDAEIRIAGPPELREVGEAAMVLAARLRQEHIIRGQWVQDIVHDLRTPLGALGSQFEAMVDGVLAPDRERLTRLQDEVRRIATLVAGFEELMRLEAPDHAPKRERIGVGPFLAALEERFRTLCGDRELVFSAGGLHEVWADEHLLFRALSNLLDNAIKYGAPGTPVELHFGLSGTVCSVRVRNRGAAIPEEYQARLFDRLFRADYARSAEGSGLGLTIGRKIAELHGGSLELAYSDVRGTEFVFSWPQPSRTS